MIGSVIYGVDEYATVIARPKDSCILTLTTTCQPAQSSDAAELSMRVIRVFIKYARLEHRNMQVRRVVYDLRSHSLDS